MLDISNNKRVCVCSMVADKVKESALRSGERVLCQILRLFVRDKYIFTDQKGCNKLSQTRINSQNMYPRSAVFD